MTKAPWFRHGLKKTKRWLRWARRTSSPIRHEITEAFERCLRKKHKRSSERFAD